MNKIIGVTGANGRLGTALVQLGAVPIVLNITDFSACVDHFREFQYDVVINCAAKTDVDWCQKPENTSETIQVNTLGAINISEAYAGNLIQLSTDFVFDGKSGKYSESAQISGTGVYGFSKELAESALEYRSDTTVIRTTQIFGTKNDFLSRALLKAMNHQEVMGIDNLYGNPTHVEFLAVAIMSFISLDRIGDIRFLHLAGTSYLSRYEFLKQAFLKFGLDITLLKKVSYESLNIPTPRPLLGGFDLSLARKLKLPLYSAEGGLEKCFKNWSRYGK